MREAYDRPSSVTGKISHKPARIVKPLGGRHSASVVIRGKFVKWADMASDAWHSVEGEIDPNARPKSSYRDGRVVTVAEWRAQRAAVVQQG